MLDHLQWNSLETHRNIAKVIMLYKITHNLVAINPDLYISTQTSHTHTTQSWSSIPNFQHTHWLIRIQLLPSYSCPLESLTTWHCLLFLWTGSNHWSKPTTTNIKHYLFWISVNSYYVVGFTRRALVFSTNETDCATYPPIHPLKIVNLSN
jgi:hypothetical protein